MGTPTRRSVDDLRLTGRLWADGLLTYENPHMSVRRPVAGNSPSVVRARFDFPCDWADLVEVYLGVQRAGALARSTRPATTAAEDLGG